MGVDRSGQACVQGSASSFLLHVGANRSREWVSRASLAHIFSHFRRLPTVTTVPRSYVSRSTFRICLSFSSMMSLTFYDLLPLTHAYDFHMLTISHVYDFHMLTVFTCFSFTYFVRLPCTI